jgi:hypothetical protein
MASTSTFHASVFKTARFPASPMWTSSPTSDLGAVVEHRAQALAHRGQIASRRSRSALLAEHERPNVRARQAAGPLDRDDLPDLLQAEAEPPRLPDEREHIQRGPAVDPVAGEGATGMGRMPASSYSRRALRVTPVRLATSPISSPFVLMRRR